MIHFAIGTKAQFIKMAPVMYLLEQAHERYHLLDLSQHGSITGKILADFDLHPVVTRMGAAGKSVETYWQAIRWLAQGFGQVIFQRHDARRRWFLDTEGVVLVHGDTLSTLLGLYLARAAKLKTGLVEAGLTSHSLLDPFPEEWIRRHAQWRADYLFAPGPAAESWLKQRTLPGRVIDTHYNTGRDALQLILKRSPKPNSATAAEERKYGIATLHRLETISSGTRLRKAIRHILALSATLGELRFYIHPPTENALRKYGLYETLTRSPNIKLYRLAPYPEFAAALCEARFILTDGGSIQEEAAYLNKPCLILRNRTERGEGLGHSAILSTWNAEKDIEHIEETLKRPPDRPVADEFEASRIILDTLQEPTVAHNTRR